MSAQIDVLAVMDRLEDYYRRHEVLIGPVDDAYSVEHKAARLAVAELIEVAASALYDMREVHERCTSLVAVGLDEQVGESIDRLSAALANVGGAK